MTMTFAGPNEDHLATIDDEVSGPEVHTVEAGALVAIARSEIEGQLDAAHRYPRSLARFRKQAETLATLSQETAESCIYAVPRGGKSITGPSVRLAEICASAWGNLHIDTRVVDETDTEIVARGVVWDLETNTKIASEVRRSIAGRNGRKFAPDMVQVTGMAAQSIAKRNAIFGVVPRALVNVIYEKVKKVAVGTAQTLVDRRTDVVGRLQKGGIPIERILARVEKTTTEDIGLEELETLVGLLSSLRAKEITPDEAFPPVGGGAETIKTKELTTKLRGATPQTAPAAVKADSNGVIAEREPGEEG